MIGGDLSNRMAPRVLTVFEGVVAELPSGKDAAYRRYRRVHAWDQAMNLYRIRPHMVKLMAHWAWSRDLKVDVVTYLGAEMLPAVEAFLARNGVICANVWSHTPEGVAASLAYSPDVMYVIHNEPEHLFLYGNRGYLATNPEEIHL